MSISRIVLFICLITNLLQGQNEHNFWYFGARAALDFSSGNPESLDNSDMIAFEGIATVSSAEGALLFYTDGLRVWNSAHEVMPNGTGLNGFFSTTQCIVVPQPLSDSIYYIFTCQHQGGILTGDTSAYYSIVDMTLDNGRGDVVEKNTFLFTPTTEKLTVFPHSNGIDYWILTHRWQSDEFLAFQLSCDGLNTTPVISVAGVVHEGGQGNISTIGYMEASSNWNRLALAIQSPNLIQVFDFDNSTGQISTEGIITIQAGSLSPYGVAFSPNDSLLYATLGDGFGGSSRLVQYNLFAGNDLQITNSVFLIDQATSGNFGAIQKGPDGKLYVAPDELPYLNAIQNPNGIGFDADYQPTAVVFNTIGASRLGLPPDFDYISPPPTLDFEVDNNCSGVPTSFSTNTFPDFDFIQWTFGAPNTGNLDTAFTNPAVHTYDEPGTYIVTLIFENACLRDTITKEITIATGTIAQLGVDTTLCEAEDFLLESGILGIPIAWNTGDTSQQITVTENGIYGILSQAELCFFGDSIEVTFASPPNLGADTIACEGDTILLDAGPSSTGDYLWSEGTITQLLAVTTTGSYAVIKTENNCIQSDSVLVEFLRPDNVIISPGDTSICIGDSILLNAAFTDANYLWQDGTTTATYSVNTAGLYTVIINTACFEVERAVEISQIGFSNTASLFEQIPNIFSPNGDNINDRFKPILREEAYDAIVDYELQVFNRWGQEIFTSNDPAIGWDGQQDGQFSPAEIYVWKLQTNIIDCNSNLRNFTKTGDITLIR